jgi:hypothetical protein
MSFDLQARPVAMPWHLHRPIHTMPEPPTPPVAPPAPPTLDLSVHEAPSYWVRRRRQQAESATELDG